MPILNSLLKEQCSDAVLRLSGSHLPYFVRHQATSPFSSSEESRMRSSDGMLPNLVVFIGGEYVLPAE